jgi:hypothetical protein
MHCFNFAGCGGTVNQNNSLLLANASDGGDFVQSARLRKCLWQIRAPPGHSIQIMIERMETEIVPNGKKCFDFEIGDQPSGKEPIRDGVQVHKMF